MDSPAAHQAYVKVGKANGNQTRPGQKHVAVIQEADATPSGETGFAEGGARETVKFSACEMAEGVAGKGIQREHDDVDAHDESAKADTEMAVEIVSEHGVIPEKPKKYKRKIEKIPVNILQDERKCRFALVFPFGRLADGASRRIEKKCPVISLPIVVAGGAKTQRACKNEQRGRKLPPMVLRIDKWRIERRQVRPPFEIRIFKGAQGGVNSKTAEQNNYGQKFNPPGVAAQSASEPRFGQEGWRASHLGTSRVAVSKSETNEC